MPCFGAPLSLESSRLSFEHNPTRLWWILPGPRPGFWPGLNPSGPKGHAFVLIRMFFELGTCRDYVIQLCKMSILLCITWSGQWTPYEIRKPTRSYNIFSLCGITKNIQNKSPYHVLIHLWEFLIVKINRIRIAPRSLVLGPARKKHIVLAQA